MRLRLYVAGRGQIAERALWAAHEVCVAMPDQCEMELVDVVSEPERAVEDNVWVAPTLIRLDPEPQRRITGDLTDTESVVNYFTAPPW